MISLPLEQGTEAWLSYRRQHGMASETPSLMGSALFYPQTPFQLWLTKKGLAQSPQHPGMARGLEFEPFAWAQFQEAYGVERCEPCVVEEDTHLLAASLDGYYERAEGGQDVKTLASPVAT
jgi:YqaJ-like viral recombinase domain